MTINTGTCPKCQEKLFHVTIEDMDIKRGFQSAWRGVSYLCPKCKTILGVGIDPVALQEDTVKEVLKGLGKKR
jgi:hypothetical protein